MVHLCWLIKAFTPLPRLVDSICCDLTVIHSFIQQVIDMYKALFQKSFKVAGVRLLLELFLPIPIKQVQLH